MARNKRVCPAGEVFHVLNRAVARLTIFEKPADYDAFMRMLEETWEIVPLPIFAIVAMPNHWHSIVRPTTDDQLRKMKGQAMHTCRFCEICRIRPLQKSPSEDDRKVEIGGCSRKPSVLHHFKMRPAGALDG